MNEQKHIESVGVFTNLVILIVGIVVTVFVIWGGFQVLLIGLDKSERAECIKWSEQAEEYPNFYLLDWQKEQCKHHNINVKN